MTLAVGRLATLYVSSRVEKALRGSKHPWVQRY